MLLPALLTLHWALVPAPGCASLAELTHGSTLVSPDSSLVRFTCDRGFRLFGSSLLYCKGDNWNGSTPVCKESDIMSSFQLKQTSLYAASLELNPDILPSHRSLFSTVSNTASKETPLKPSLLGVSQPKTFLTGDLAKNKPPKKLWFDKPTTQSNRESAGLKETSTKLDTPQQPARNANPLAISRLALVNSPTALMILSPGTLSSKSTESITLDTAVINEQKAQMSSSLLDQSFSSPTNAAVTHDREALPQTALADRAEEDLLPRTEVLTAATRLGPALHMTRSPDVTTTDAYLHYPAVTKAAREETAVGEDSAAPVDAHSSQESRSGYEGLCVPTLPCLLTFYFRTMINPGPFQYKHYIQYACYPGYTLANGDVYSYCLHDGQWSGATPMCIEVTPCSLNNGGCSQVCQVSHENRAECHCQPGFLLLQDHRTCRDLDECVEGLHQCQQVCENMLGSYRCSCRHGFKLSADRMSCSVMQYKHVVPHDIRRDSVLAAVLLTALFLTLGRFCPPDVDECAVAMDRVGCVFGCVNTLGSFLCRCPPGHSLNPDGRCEDKDECIENGGQGPCEGACVNTPGSFHCVCPYGYQLAGDGRACISECPPGHRKQRLDAPVGNSTIEHCVDIDECKETEQNQPDRCEWKCVNLPGTHHCICPRGYTQLPGGHRCR
ncbi:hypothetical protein P4O66_021995, partial [Electrophorus voltai]